MITENQKIEFVPDKNSCIPHLFLYVNNELQADICEHRNNTLFNAYFVSYHLQNNIYTAPIEHFDSLEEAKQFLTKQFEDYSNTPHIIYHPLYNIGWWDGRHKNVPNDQLKSNTIYYQGWEEGYSDILEQYHHWLSVSCAT